MRRKLTTEDFRQLHQLVYDATIFELAETLFTQHRDIELELLIELIQEKRRQDSTNAAPRTDE